ncbi:MAG: hypothetical protein Q8M66_03140 [Actinomycetota bacterium]|nr:hypothetical protein [Actinomycetota bacterium]MDZ4179406.1 hypothetical protein [Coriobacteriia bacterium]
MRVVISMMYLMLTVFAVLVWLAVRTVSAGTMPVVPTHAGSAIEGAIAVARNRLVRGEIDRCDYDRIVRVLRS